jgi:molybdenum cofactor biosynthesis enzyme MoaA
MKRLEIHISYQCHNKCIFCSEKNRLFRFKNIKVDFNNLIQLLAQKRKQGFNHVNFTGGEPTLYEDFYKLLKVTRQLGYRIYIGSNGIFWSDYKNCQKYLPLIDEISLSIHGYNKNMHERHTGNSNSFDLILKSFVNINKYLNTNNKIYFFSNTVITNLNFNELNQLLELLVKFSNLKQILFSNIAPEGQAHKNYYQLAVPYDQIKNKVGEWVDFANKNKKIIRFFGLPLCILGKYQIYSNDLNWDERLTYELGYKNNQTLLKPKETILQRKRQKIGKCEKCMMSELCGGIFFKYLELFDTKEIKPFIKK